MPRCYTCQEEITFDKNILSKTGKQIPLWADKMNAHGHDEDGNAIRQPLPNQRQQSTISIEKAFPSKTTTQGGGTMDTKRIFQILKELDERIYQIEEKLNKVLEKIEYNTQVDTDKLIGQLQILNDTILPVLKTQIKKGSELYKEQQKKEDPITVNHFDKADRHETAFRDRRKIVEENDQADDDEFERTKKFVPENHNVDDDENDDKIETED